MKRVTTIFLFLCVVCFLVIMWGAKRAALMAEINEAGMYLVSNTTDTPDFHAKLYEIAYSSPVAPQKVGLWLESLLANDFETFSTKQMPLTPQMARKLKGWPLSRSRELDFSGTAVSDSIIADLGKFPKATWINYSQTAVTERTLERLAKQAPKIEKLQLNKTPIRWSEDLVKDLRILPYLKEVEWNETPLTPEDLDRLL